MPEFKCDQCGKIFHNEGSLNQHVNDKHLQKLVEQKTPDQSKAPLPTQEQKKSGGMKLKLGMGKSTLLAILAVVVAAGAGYGAYSYFSDLPSDSSGVAESLSQPIGSLGSTHIHADTGIFLEGEELTPLSPSYFVRSPFVHVESGAGAGTVVHMHATGTPLSFFFRSLGMNFNSECFRLDNGREYCNDGNKTLKMFTKQFNGEWEENRQFHTYIFTDLDQILITYGDETQEEIEQQQDSVTSASASNSGREMDLRGIGGTVGQTVDDHGG